MDDANSAADDALAALIAAPAATVEEVAGKLDRAWQFYGDGDPCRGELCAILGRMTKRRPVARELADLAESLGPGVYVDLVRSAATDAAARSRLRDHGDRPLPLGKFLPRGRA